MKNKDWLVGILLRQGRLKTKIGEILLTAYPREAGEAAESEKLPVGEENAGKMVMASGNLVGDVLYSAEVVETLPRLTGALIQKLVEKEIISLSEIQEHLSHVEDKDLEAVEPKKLCALVIGHKKSSPGAINKKTGLNEFDFNENLAIRIEKKAPKTRIQRVYRRIYKELPDDINALKSHFSISLHCNAHSGRISGTEVLYYHRSDMGKKIARILQTRLVGFLGLRDRGIKPKSSEDRGGYLLRYTRSPCIIAEPFFIDNDKDLARAQEDLEGLAAVYAAAIDVMAEIV